MYEFRAGGTPDCLVVLLVASLVLPGCALLFRSDPVDRPDAATDATTDMTEVDPGDDGKDVPDGDDATDGMSDGDAVLDPSTDAVDMADDDTAADPEEDPEADAAADPVEDVLDVDDPWLDADAEPDTPLDTVVEDTVIDPAADDGEPPIQVALDHFDLVTDTDGDTVPDDAPLLITEIQVNPQAVPDYDGEYLEILNITPHALDVIGLSVSDETSTYTVTSSLVLPPGGYLLLGRTDTAGASYGVPSGSPDFAYLDANLTLSNTLTEHLALEYGGHHIHDVAYDTGTTPSTLTNIGAGPVTARSFNLDQSVIDAGGPASAYTWCVTPEDASYVYNTASTYSDYGTPGHANHDCP